MNIADAALSAIDANTNASLALTQPNTSATAAAAIRKSDESSNAVIDMA